MQSEQNSQRAFCYSFQGALGSLLLYLSRKLSFNEMSPVLSLPMHIQIFRAHSFLHGSKTESNRKNQTSLLSDFSLLQKHQPFLELADEVNSSLTSGCFLSSPRYFFLPKCLYKISVTPPVIVGELKVLGIRPRTLSCKICMLKCFEQFPQPLSQLVFTFSLNCVCLWVAVHSSFSLCIYFNALTFDAI